MKHHLDELVKTLRTLEQEAKSIPSVPESLRIEMQILRERLYSIFSDQAGEDAYLMGDIEPAEAADKGALIEIAHGLEILKEELHALAA
jgi:hypothetical protein